jgi:outer membrane immunogenic protein
MLYGTGGLAYAHIKESTSLNRPDGQIAFGGFPFSFACNPTTIPCFNGSSARTEFGWTAGGGAEYAINRTFSLKFEYLYIGLREDRINVVAQRASVQSRDTPSSFTAIYGRADFQTVRVGLNAHF